jgi:uncharacterized protein YbjT (DUF2867 family)
MGKGLVMLGDGTGPRRVLVTGATGYIGGRLVPELLDAGYEVRCLARSPAKLDGRSWSERVEVVEGDVSDSVSAAMEGVDAAYYPARILRYAPACRES